MSGCSPVVPTIADMQSVVQDKFGLQPYAWQLQSAQYQIESMDVFTVSPTSSGKTLTFWIPLLFNNNGIIIIITPLNILGEKICDEAIQCGFPAINLCAATALDQAYKICSHSDQLNVPDEFILSQDIGQLKYCVITVSHKHIPTNAHFWVLSLEIHKLFNITFDEGHCISEWGDDLRPLYGQLGNLRWFLPKHTTFHVVLATMPPHILTAIEKIICSSQTLGS
ncbi:hypothetical protein PAXRUDRAFT_155609 [Paxillus rubicundulus Ve08.2h10]|uniref:DNA 3'-5' helicase n=1 Tax=Paxillus rubicundulus Ve08.2h10 TaxID=930991 RepID=A0A0D0DQI6_9AGAM|nr:hypothetical protein PAXRUDRAFT_155609 [Paxillus rubicundulus Ve08.2h10]